MKIHTQKMKALESQRLMPQCKQFKVSILGDSMWPALKSGNTLIVDLIGDDQLLGEKDVGELFVFKDEELWICHRYLGVQELRHVFKGDFSTTYESITKPRVLGKVFGLQIGERSYCLKNYKIINQVVAGLQKKSIFSKKYKKLFRYLSLVVEISLQPFLYKKIEPTPVIK